MTRQEKVQLASMADLLDSAARNFSAAGDNWDLGWQQLLQARLKLARLRGDANDQSDYQDQLDRIARLREAKPVDIRELLSR